MTVLTEGRHPSEFVVAESPGTISRDPITLALPATTVFAPGTVLGQLAADGTYVPYDDADTDGREEAVGVLYGEARNDAATPATVPGVIVNWGAEVRRADLVFLEGVDET